MAKQSKFSHKTRPAKWFTRRQRREHNRVRRFGVPTRPKERTTTLTAESYRVKYLVGGNDSLSRLLRWNRMLRSGQ